MNSSKLYDFLMSEIKSKGANFKLRKLSGGVNFYQPDTNWPVARIKMSEGSDMAEILWWSHREKWEQIGEFGGVVIPVKEVVSYILSDRSGCFGL